MGVALRGALVFGCRDGCRVAAWRILRRIEWQVRHSDRFEDTTTYALGNKYSLHHLIDVRLPQHAPEVRRSLRRQVTVINHHQIERALARHAGQAGTVTCRAGALNARRRTKLIEQ